MQTDKHTDAGLIVQVNDGPAYHPNFKRTVKLLAWDVMPGFVICEDQNSGEILSIFRQKIEQSKLEMLQPAEQS